MDDKDTMLEFLASDLQELTVDDIICTNCIKGFCPARTPSMFDQVEFTLCGAKKNTQPVLERYQERTGTMVHIERPC